VRCGRGTGGAPALDTEHPDGGRCGGDGCGLTGIASIFRIARRVPMG
jgi:hypothetical protein